MEIERPNNSVSVVDKDSNTQRINCAISSGNKCLDLTIDFSGRTAYTHLDTIPNTEKIPGATTAVFTVARDMMQSEASKRNITIGYVLSTNVPSMIEWALDVDKGKRIFSWDGEPQVINKQLRASRDFLPEVEENEYE